jgi:GNAT superfamily N-acetyltransferase
MPQLFDLRWRVLRPGRPFAATAMPGDDAEGTIHLGAFSTDSTSRLLAIASLMENEGLQLRGMASDPVVRGMGAGRLVLQEAHRTAAERGLPLWCNARVSAMGFYEKMGWEVEGLEFEVPDIGPHYVMRYCGNGGAATR